MTTQFDWLLYLDVADYLRRQRGQQFYRSAVSRAYYGVFCHIRDTLRGASFSQGGEVHGQVINALKNHPSPTVARLSFHLDNLRRERNRADYASNVRFSESDARRALSSAWGIRNIVRNSLR